jgi:hypothetical protein
MLQDIAAQIAFSSSYLNLVTVLGATGTVGILGWRWVVETKKCLQISRVSSFSSQALAIRKYSSSISSNKTKEILPIII